MTGGGDRVVLRTHMTARYEIRDLLAGAFASELIAPSRCLWLVSPWLRDIEVLDNRSAAFRGVGPTWGRRTVRLYEALAALAERGSSLVVATRSSDDGKRAIDELRRRLAEAQVDDRLSAVSRPELHAKGLLADGFCISGSMNFTHHGVQHAEEMIRYETAAERVAELRVAFRAEYGGVL